MQIDITESERKTLLFYLEKALIDAQGLRAIGAGSSKTVDNIKSLMYKAEKGNNHG